METYGQAAIRTAITENHGCFEEGFWFPSLAETKILALPGRDYGFRLIVPKAVWVEVLKELANEQFWANFKTEAETRKADTGGDYVNKLHAVWWKMVQLQKPETKRGRSWQYGRSEPVRWRLQ